MGCTHANSSYNLTNCADRERGSLRWKVGFEFPENLLNLLILIDAAEASAIYDFVTEKGGKVILAASSTNAQRVAEEFGVLFFAAPILDRKWFYEVANSVGEREPEDQTRLWSVASVNQDLDEMDQASLRTPCTEELVSSSQVDNCRMPVLFHSPTAIQVLDLEDDSREVNVLASASDSAFVARNGPDINNIANPKTGKTDLMIRIDYPGIEAVSYTHLTLPTKSIV